MSKKLVQGAVVCALSIAFVVYFVTSYGYEKLVLYGAVLAAMALNGRVLGTVLWDRAAVSSAAFLWLSIGVLVTNGYVFMGAGEHKYVVALLWLPALMGTAAGVATARR